MANTDPRVWCGLHKKLEPYHRVGLAHSGKEHIFHTNFHHEIKGKSECGRAELVEETDLSIPSFRYLRASFCRLCIRRHSDDEGEVIHNAPTADVDNSSV